MKKLRQELPYKLFLPLWKRVIFVDWFGVLSHDLFWHSILNNQKHPYYQAIKNTSEKLFLNNSQKVQQWMRGEMSASEVLAHVPIELDKRAKDDFLLRRLYNDCRKLSFKIEMLQAIREMSEFTSVVIATDNMDCFADQVQSIPQLKNLVDDVLSSSRIGVLKTDSVYDFFNSWLKDHGLDFKQALLIDDNEKTCAKFHSVGGTAIAFKSEYATLSKVKEWLNVMNSNH